MFIGNANTLNPFDDFLEAIRWQGGTAEAMAKIRSLFMVHDQGSLTTRDTDLLLTRWKTLFEYLAKKQNNQLTQLSFKEDHPDWFKGIWEICNIVDLNYSFY